MQRRNEGRGGEEEQGDTGGKEGGVAGGRRRARMRRWKERLGWKEKGEGGLG